MSYYDTAQICLNGHLITASAGENRHFLVKHCDKCGESTIMQCQKCNCPIRGVSEGMYIIYFKIPSYCIECGNPYPWTEKKIQATKELIDELDELTPEEREKLKLSINDLITDTPRSEVAVTIFKKNIPKINKVLAKSLLDMAVGIATDAVKKSLLGI